MSGCVGVQWAAVGIASSAIVVLTIDYGRLPWIALTLAASFGLYGFVKKRVVGRRARVARDRDRDDGVPALITIGVIAANGSLVFGRHGVGNTALLVGTGVVTAIPLLFFGAATRRLPLSAMGMLQYLTPILQFGVGIGIDHEKMPLARWAGFGLVWIALVVLTVDGVRASRRPAEEPAGAPG